MLLSLIQVLETLDCTYPFCHCSTINYTVRRKQDFRLTLTEFEYGFVTAATFLFLGVLYPIMWHMWIMTGTGNANFYYALTLVTAVCNGYIISDSVSAINKRKFLIKHGQ